MNILHIIDDQKFVGVCKNTFDIENLNNHYLESGEISLAYLTKNKIDIIFIHFLRKYEIDFFSRHNVKIKKIWMFWGADGFSLPLFYNVFLDEDNKKTRQIIEKKQGVKRYLIHNVKILFKKFINSNKNTKKTVDVINSFDFIVPIVPGDYYLLKEKYYIKPPMNHFNYITKLFKNETININRKNIILGNSATYSNNHISIIKKLKNLNLGNRKVYVPLNYGNTFYKDYILRIIKGDDRFIAITDFLKLEDYNRIIDSCEIMIMNHERQQALGNVILGLMSGNTIYLNKKSTLYKYLKDCGFVIFDVEDFDENYVIDTENKEKNIRLTENYFGKERQLKKIKNLIYNQN